MDLWMASWQEPLPSQSHVAWPTYMADLLSCCTSICEPSSYFGTSVMHILSLVACCACPVSCTLCMLGLLVLSVDLTTLLHAIPCKRDASRQW